MTATRRRAIDVHGAKGPVDWRAVAGDGITVAFVKASEGKTFVDPRVAANVRGARDAGLHVAPYHFARPDDGNTPAQEAAGFLAVIDGLPFDMVPVLDMEKGTGELSSWALDFLARVSNRYQHAALIYSDLAYVRGQLRNPTLARFPLWLADYGPTSPPPAPAPWNHVTVWQFTSSGTVAGVAGRCDMSELHDDDIAALLLAQEDDMSYTDTDRTRDEKTAEQVQQIYDALYTGDVHYGVFPGMEGMTRDVWKKVTEPPTH